MDFFKSVFSPDLDDPEHDRSSDAAAAAAAASGSSHPSPNPVTGGGWNLGGLIKTVASRSESVIQTYRKDLEEFGTGLKKETAAIREVAARSVDEIIKHGKEVLAVDSNDDSSHSDAAGKKYTRLEAQIMAIQSDEGTFITDPEDVRDFEKWKIRFDLEEKKEEIEMLLYDCNVLESMYEKFVPDIVDYWTFWYRYFYRVYKAKQAEEARAELVKRVISREEEEEELSWDVEDDEELDKIEGLQVEKASKDGEKTREIDEKEVGEKKTEELNEIDEQIEGIGVEENVQQEGVAKEELNELGMQKGGNAEIEEIETSKELEIKHEEKVTNASVEIENDKTTSVPEPVLAKTPEVPTEVSTITITNDVKLSLKTEAEEDLEWDEIEDLGEGDSDKPTGSIGGSDTKLKEDLRKRLSVAEDDEDLTWDIEEDDDDDDGVMKK